MSQTTSPPSQHVRRVAKITYTIIVLVLVGGTAVYWARFQREHHRWSEVIRLWDGRHLQIHQHSSNTAYHGAVGHGSPFWWGGGDPWHETHFTIDGKTYRWEGPYIPIAIQPDKDDTVYVVVYDRESEESKRHPTDFWFRLYRSRDGRTWDEIGPKEFPKHLAIQNTWLNEHNGELNEYEIVAKMDPKDPWFLRSFTAALWRLLESPDETRKDFVESAAREYKATWIRPVTIRSASADANESER